LENWEEGEPAYLRLTSGDLSGLAGVVADLLGHAGVGRGSRVLVYDFNTSLSTLALSRVFTPGLNEGVCERVGCVAICTDGLSELAARSAFAYTLWQPDTLLIRSELVSPFIAKLRGKGLQEANPRLERVLVVHSDVSPWPRRIGLGAGRFDRRMLYRVDPALFACIVEPCGGLYYPEDSYRAGVPDGGSGRLEVAPSFASRKRPVVSALECRRVGGVHSCGKAHHFAAEEPHF
jgi:hypothetical protein